MAPNAKVLEAQALLEKHISTEDLAVGCFKKDVSSPNSKPLTEQLVDLHEFGLVKELLEELRQRPGLTRNLKGHIRKQHGLCMRGEARAILERQHGTDELYDRCLKKDQDDPRAKHFIEELREHRGFGLARGLLEKLRKRSDIIDERKELVRQQYALSTYKDPDLPAKDRLDRAFRILSDERDLSLCKDPETLGIAGAIVRRYWNLDGQRTHLERALKYYSLGHELSRNEEAVARKDRGYTGINAAFLLDQLASLNQESGSWPGDLARLQENPQEHARKIRGEVLDLVERHFPPEDPWRNEWWVTHTRIEAYFGLRDFARATKEFENYNQQHKAADWQVESSLKQLVGLARIHGYLGSAGDTTTKAQAMKCLETVLGKRDPNLILVADYKVGLALSGGGLRASFYEIGVLAALAEYDLLRHVQVLSTVSGGSILGAQYYLQLKKLLDSTPDGDLEKSDYVQLVEELARSFLKGVEQNIRTRVILNPIETARMFFTNQYSRTLRAGDLYDRFLYRHLQGDPSEPVKMQDLLITPAKRPDSEAESDLDRDLGLDKESFSPNAQNWEREAKVPILVINATTLNTGHNWQFTARSMGEPLVDPFIDANPRFRRMNYTELERTAVAKYSQFPLGHAVAASACVPGLFEPLKLRGLYEDSPEGKTTVRLVDGGVHDNQGIASLLEQDCNVLIVADASGQMPFEHNPSESALGSVLRSNSVMMARIREAQFQDVRAQRESGRRKGFAFIHMKQDLHTPPINWVECADPKKEAEGGRVDKSGLTSYGIRKTAQEKIAKIRTDLDSFSEIEAFSLMYSGYRTARHVIPKTIDAELRGSQETHDWKFLSIAPALTGKVAATKDERRVEKHLEIASLAAFRVWRLDPKLMLFGVVLLAMGAIVLFGWKQDQDWTLLTVNQVRWIVAGAIGSIAAGAVLESVAARWVKNLIRPRELLTRILFGVGLSIFGSIAALVHLSAFDERFKKIGRWRTSGGDR